MLAPYRLPEQPPQTLRSAGRRWRLQHGLAVASFLGLMVAFLPTPPPSWSNRPAAGASYRPLPRNEPADRPPPATTLPAVGAPIVDSWRASPRDSASKCDPPYFTDEHGRKQYRIQCL